MRATFGSAGISVIGALALALSLGAVVLPAGVHAKDAPKATNSPEFGKVAGPFQKEFNDFLAKKGKVSDAEFKAAAQALAPKVPAIEAAVKTPLDRLIAGDWARQIGMYANDDALTARGLDNMLASGQLQPDVAKQVGAMRGQMAYLAKDYPKAIEVLTPLVAGNYNDDAIAQMLAESYASAGNPAQGIEAIKTAIAARKAAGGKVPDDWFARANRIAYNAKLGPQAIEMVTLQVQNDPTALNWLGAGQLVREFGGFSKEESLDLGRLFVRSGALDNEPKYTEREYIEYIQAADPRRLPGEVQKVTEQGIAKGALKTSDPFVSDALAQAKSRVAADKASLAGLEKETRASASGKTAAATADAYLSYGEAAKAEEFYQMALQKGGADANLVLTRLGIAMIDQGKVADAKAALAKVTGVRAPLARLWSIYADTKGAQ